MSTLVAVLDADALVPLVSCDLLLSAFDEDLYRPVVTATILDEIERSLLGSFTHLDPVALRDRVAQAPSQSPRDQTSSQSPLRRPHRRRSHHDRDPRALNPPARAESSPGSAHPGPAANPSTGPRSIATTRPSASTCNNSSNADPHPHQRGGSRQRPIRSSLRARGAAAPERYRALPA